MGKNLLFVIRSFPSDIIERVNSKVLTVTIALLILHRVVSAQDFDADSIYYTPIPKVKPTEETAKKRPFVEDPTLANDSASNTRFVEYFFNVQIGTLIGCSDCISGKEVTLTSSTVHGVTIGKKFRVGGGMGFDSYYDWQTMPIFASASWDIIGTKNTNAFFVQFDYGWSQPWRTEKMFEFGETGVKGGPMAYGMAGLRIKYYDLRISISLGGKYQGVSTYFETPSYYYDQNGNLVPGKPSRTTIEETMRRFAVAITIGWK